MTVIRPNSVSGITSITAQANEINFFRSNGALAGLQLNGVNFNTTTGVSTFNNLDVGGVLTYQDVTNVDSLGIGTFRTGIKVLAGGINVVGVVTATAFHGDGSALTGIAADKIFEGNTEVETIDTGSDGHIKLTTEGTERIRIDSAGRVGLGTIAPSSFHANADNFVIMSDNAPVGMTLMTTNGGLDSTIAFADGTSGGTELQGAIIYQHNGDAMRFLVAQNERLRITAQNAIGIGGANYGTAGQFLKSQGSGAGAIWSTISTDIVNDTSPQLGGNLDVNTKNILFGDSNDGSSDDVLKFGAGSDLQIHSDGTNGVLRQNNNSGGLYIQADNFVQIGKVNAGSPIYGKFIKDGAVELYHAGSKKFETVTGGIKVTGAYALAASSGNNPTIDNADGGQGRNLYFKTGGSARLIIQEDGHTRPASNNTFDLGTTSDRWRNIYTMDLHCSNKGSSNDVDGTWGDYTIQEGENDLFLINNRSGKKYKFNLTEVS